MKKNVSIFIFLVLVMCFSVFGFSACTSDKEKVTTKAVKNTQNKQITVDDRPIVTIGVPTPLTGDAALLGTGLRDAMELAIKEVSTKNTKYQYRIVFEDDQLNNAKTVSAFQKMLTADKISAVVGFSSGTSHAIAPLAEENKIPMVAIASDPAIVKDKAYVFLNWVTPEEEVRVFADEVKKRGYKKVAIFSTNQQGMIAVRDQLVRILGKEMFPVDEVFEPDEKDFKTSILKGQKANVDAYMLNLLPGQLIVSAKQIRQLGVDKPLTAIEAFEFENDPDGLLEGQWFVTNDEPSNEFVNALQEKYGHGPTLGSAYGYDIVHLYVAVFEKAGKNNPDGVVAELHKIKDFEGAMGTLTVADDNRVQSVAAVKVMKGGKPVKVY